MSDASQGAADLAALDHAVEAARSGDDARALTQALRRRAAGRLNGGRFAGAAADLDEASEIHRRHEQTGERARCLHMAATAARMGGDLDGAATRAEVAIALVEDAGPVAVAAWTERGETAHAGGQFTLAGEYLDTAAERAEAAGLLPEHLANLHRRRAQSWMAAGSAVRAASCLLKARVVAEEAGLSTIALRAMIEEAAAWITAGDLDEAEQVIEGAGREAGRLADDAALCDLELQRAALALHRGLVQDALACVRSARALALSAVHPVGYTAAAVAMSELAERLGDREGAYEALAVGWATLGDLLGPDVARASFEPKLRALVDQWGEAEFVRIRDAVSGRG